MSKNNTYHNNIILLMFYALFSFSFAQDCADNQVPNCNQDPNSEVSGGTWQECCSAAWVGDGICDGLSQAYGCDLSCYDSDGGDCNCCEGDECGEGTVCNDCECEVVTCCDDPSVCSESEFCNDSCECETSCCDDPSVCSDGEFCNDSCACEESPPEPGDDCENALDYGVINTDTILSGTFIGTQNEDYWYSFTTTCTWRDVIISTCGSDAEFGDDGLEYVNTVLEVYQDTDDGQSACSQYQDWSIEFGQVPSTEWWNDDPEGDDVCDGDNGESTHAVLMIPTAEQQGPPNFDKLYPGTYFIRISTYPGPTSVGDYQIQITGRPEVAASAPDQELLLPHDPFDEGAPGGYYYVDLDASECICNEQISNYEWWYLGDTDSLIAGPTQEIIESVFMPHGTHQLELKVTDNLNIEYTDDFTVDITEPNTAPIADAGSDTSRTIPHDGDLSTISVTVVLSAELSSDSDTTEEGVPDDLYYQWEQIAGPSDVLLSDDTALSPSFNPFNQFDQAPKLYEFELTVTDNYGESDKDSIEITIYSEENSPPIASAPHLEINIEHDGDTTTHHTELFILDGSPSSDSNPEENDNINSYVWYDSLGDTLGVAAFVEHMIDADTELSVLGDHFFQLVVKDVYNDIDDTTIVVTVGPELNLPPIVAFDPEVVTFTLNPDENVGGSQLIILDAYNATTDPEDDPMQFQWFDSEGDSLTSTLQSVTQGTTSFVLRATDSYGDFTEGMLNVIVQEPNIIPTVMLIDFTDRTESTANLQGSADGLDELLLTGVYDDENPNELGGLWTLLSDNSDIVMLNDLSLDGTFYSGEILHNSFPDSVDFSLTVWDPFSCYPLNSELYDAENDVWDFSCPDGENDSTYGVDTMTVIIKNYNSAPVLYPENAVSDDYYPSIEINEDENYTVTFDYDFWSESGFFSDVDDCDFDPDLSICTGYSDSNFTVNMLPGENYSSEDDQLLLLENFYGQIEVPFKINDNNIENNLSQIDTLFITVLPVNDKPEIISYENNELEQNGVQEDTPFQIFLEDFIYYDVEGDTDSDGTCDEDECGEITIAAVVGEDYTITESGWVSTTENYDDSLQLGIQITDGQDVSEFYFIDVDVQGVNDPPVYIEGATPDTLFEDFDLYELDMYSLFFDVDGDILDFSKESESLVCIVDSIYIDDNYSTQENCESASGVWTYFFLSDFQLDDTGILNIESQPDLYGDHSIEFSATDPDGLAVNQTIEFYVSPVNDPPEVVDDYLYTPTNTVDETTDLTITLQATDVDSDSVSFVIPDGQLLNGDFCNDLGECGGPPEPIHTGPYTATIIYRADIEYKCDETFQYLARDYADTDGDGEVELLSESEFGTITVEVGLCNVPPVVTVTYSNNGTTLYSDEDQEITFINNLGVGWCEVNGEYSQVLSDECADGSWSSAIPLNYLELNDPDFINTSDEQPEDIVYLELHEGDNYYLERGFCARADQPEDLDAGIEESDWYINTELPCGLIAENEACLGALSESGYDDLPVYCGCIEPYVCVASQLYMADECYVIDDQDICLAYGEVFECTDGENDGDSYATIAECEADTDCENCLGRCGWDEYDGCFNPDIILTLDEIVVRPEQDYEDSIHVIIAGYDTNDLYSLSDEEVITFKMNPHNDAPIITEIDSLATLEDESIVIDYYFVEDESDIDLYIGDYDFVLFDSDNTEDELQFFPTPSAIYSQAWDQENRTITIEPAPNWNGRIDVGIKFVDYGDTDGDGDLEFENESQVEFNLFVEQVDDATEYTSAQVNGQDAIVIMEDAVLSNPIVQIYFTDIDADTTQNEDEVQIPDPFQWAVSAINGQESNIFFSPTAYFAVQTDPVTNEVYYEQGLNLSLVADDWNGEDGVVLTDPLSNSSIVLDVLVKQSNDIPEVFYLSESSILDYNTIAIEENEEICNDPTLAQGEYTELDECIVPNFFTLSKYICSSDPESTLYENQSDCESQCQGSEAQCSSIDNFYYRLPFSGTPSLELPIADNMKFEWHETSDIDMDPQIGNQYNDMEILYRVELVDKSNKRVLVLKDSIDANQFVDASPHIEISLDDSYFSYEYESEKDCDQNCLNAADGSGTIELCCNDYYDKCIHEDLTLADTSTFNIDLTGNTMYHWRVSANNDWCDDLGNNPSRSSSLSNENVIDSFYIDITPPYASISVIQNQIAPDFMKIYISYDEKIEPWRSEIFITNESGDTESNNFPDESAENLYTVTEVFPSTGLITIDVESWDKVGNGIISRKQLVYDEVSPLSYSSISSPSNSLLIHFEPDDIESASTILVQEEGSYRDLSQRSDLQQISPVYKITSADMVISDKVDFEINVPEQFLEIDYWKFRIRLIEENVMGKDITTWSKNGKVYGEINELSSVALYYDASAEYEIPDNIDLIGSYPNPFNPRTSIFYIVSNNNSDVRISILDLLGREVKTLYSKKSDMGYFEVEWDGTNNQGVELGSGIYFISARISGEHHYKKIMKLK